MDSTTTGTLTQEATDAPFETCGTCGEVFPDGTCPDCMDILISVYIPSQRVWRRDSIQIGESSAARRLRQLRAAGHQATALVGQRSGGWMTISGWEPQD